MITRFAPSPTGPLHLGHAYSALVAYDLANEHDSTFLLRIEDIDQSRARAAWEEQIYDDLTWLGLHWPVPVMRQSERLPAYQAVLETIWRLGCAFVCTCNRRDVQNAISAPQEGAELPTGPDGLIYPGTCRAMRSLHDQVPDFNTSTVRLFMARATQAVSERVSIEQVFRFQETGQGPNGETGMIEFTAADAIRDVGDIVLARRDMGTSYHLSVVVDDAAQGVTHVVRGQDLFEATKIHVILQKLLNLPTPIYHHHALIRDENGKRLAKRDDARAIATYRAEGASPQDIVKMVGL